MNQKLISFDLLYLSTVTENLRIHSNDSHTSRIVLRIIIRPTYSHRIFTCELGLNWGAVYFFCGIIVFQLTMSCQRLPKAIFNSRIGTNPNSTMPESKNTETLPKANGVANAPDAKLDVGVCTNCWRKLLRLERRPLVLSGIATTFLIFMALVAFVTYLLLAPTATIATDNELPGDGEDSRPTGPHNSTIGICTKAHTYAHINTHTLIRSLFETRVMHTFTTYQCN